ncbi:MAG: PAS domain S-box protein [Cyclobacteriaceae bacterium]|nr:PAS domain S-box protein [Cyclobacteriaceae bacterium]
MSSNQTNDTLAALTRERSFAMLSQSSLLSITGADKRIIYINDNFEFLTGYTPQELIGQTHKVLASGKHSPAVFDDMWQSVGKGQCWRGKLCGKTKSGELYWEETCATPVLDDQGNVSCVMFVGHEITREKEQEFIAAEEQRLMLLEKERLRALIEAFPDAIVFKDGEGCWRVANEHAKQLFGLDQIEWLGKRDEELLELDPPHAHLYRYCMSEDAKAWNSGKMTIIEDVVPTRDGDTPTYQIRRVPIFSADGSRLAMLVVGTDITAARAAEAEVKGVRTMLEKTMKLARVGGWEVDFVTNEVIWSGFTKEMTGVPPEYRPNLLDVLSFYKEGESRDKILELVDRSKLNGKGFEAELTVVSRNGREYIIRTIAEPVMLDGVCVKISGYFQDITDQVAMRKKNEQIERKFSRLTARSADGIILHDERGVISFASDAVHRMLGYQQGELIGTMIGHLAHPDDVLDVEEHRRRVCNAHGEAVPITAGRLRRRNGIYVRIDGTITNLMSDPDVQAIVLNFRDSTERYHSLEQLKSKNDHLQRIARIISHDVRGPVATIQGLMNNYNYADPHDPFNEVILQKIRVPMDKLDQVIARIVHESTDLD